MTTQNLLPAGGGFELPPGLSIHSWDGIDPACVEARDGILAGVNGVLTA